VNRLDKHRLDNRTLTIIDSPEETLKQPYLNRPFLDHWTEKIATAENEPGSRSNPLYATLAGMGKGKTRFFVELEKALNQRTEHDALAVAITFNGAFTKVEKFDEKDLKMSMAVEVVLRMLTMAYSVADFHRFRKEFTEALRTLQGQEYVGYGVLLQECAKFLVEDVRRSRPCKTFVLLVDEPRHMVEKGIAIDAFENLRGALLNREILDKEKMGFRVRMAMTALDMEPTGARDSGREIAVMPLPTNLSVDEMYSLWLPAHLPQLANLSNVDDTTERHLRQLLVLTAPLPRATEFLVDTLLHVFEDRPLSFTDETTPRILKELLERVSNRYDTSGRGAKAMLDNAQLVYSILWKEDVEWGFEVNRAMIEGYLVNPPAYIHNAMLYTPVMAALSLCRLNTDGAPADALLKPVVEATVNVLTYAIAYHSAGSLGQRLALLGNAFVTCKLLSAERVDRGVYSLFELLGCQDLPVAPTSAKFKNKGLSVTTSSSSLDDFYHPTPLPRSHLNIAEHLAGLRKCQLGKRDVLVVKGHKHEGWDGLWVLRKKDGKPFVLAVDYKFREVGRTSKAAAIRYRANNVQAVYFRDTIVAACKEAFPGSSEFDDDSAAAAIAAGDYAFVYIDTLPSKKAATSDVSRVFDDDDCYIRLTGAATWEVLTAAGQQVLDIVRLSSTPHELSKRKK
jgi:hypothetical protein